jgi:hypothetical protein
MHGRQKETLTQRYVSGKARVTSICRLAKAMGINGARVLERVLPGKDQRLDSEIFDPAMGI